MSRKSRPEERLMLTGTVSEYDSDGLFGLIDADDGHLVLFNVRSFESALRDQFRVGTRVMFDERSGGPAPRAFALAPLIHTNSRP